MFVKMVFDFLFFSTKNIFTRFRLCVGGGTISTSIGDSL